MSQEMWPRGSMYRQRMGCGVLLGIILVLAGSVLLLQALGLLPWFRWKAFWAVLLIILGVAMIAVRFRRY